MDFTEVFDVLITGLIKVLIIIIPIALGLLTKAIIKYLKEQENILKAKGKLEEIEVLIVLSELAISAAEQLFSTNKAKLDFALAELIRSANHKGISLTMSDAELLIEGSVKAVKNAIGPDFEVLTVDYDPRSEKPFNPRDDGLLNSDPILSE
jgi:hypothetical protein